MVKRGFLCVCGGGGGAVSKKNKIHATRTLTHTGTSEFHENKGAAATLASEWVAEDCDERVVALTGGAEVGKMDDVYDEFAKNNPFTPSLPLTPIH